MAYDDAQRVEKMNAIAWLVMGMVIGFYIRAEIPNMAKAFMRSRARARRQASRRMPVKRP